MIALVAVSACSEKEVVSNPSPANPKQEINIDTLPAEQMALETYSAQEFDHPLVVPFEPSEMNKAQHYADSLQIVGWASDGKLCFIEAPSMMSMSDEYQMNFKILGPDGKLIFKWRKPPAAQTKDIYSTLGLYLVNFIAKMQEQGIQPLKKLNIDKGVDIQFNNSNYFIKHTMDSDTTYQLKLEGSDKNYDIKTVNFERAEPFGMKMSEYFGHFYSHNFNYVCILIHEQYQHIEGDVRHHLNPIIIDLKKLRN